LATALVWTSGGERLFRLRRAIILPVVLYGCEAWSLTLREEHRTRVSESRVLREIFGAKRGELTGEWRRLHNEELYALYSLPNINGVIKPRRMGWAGYVARVGERRGAYRVLMRNVTERHHLGNLRLDGSVRLKFIFIFKKWDGKAWTGLIWLRKGRVYGLL
jgi:hypothetical protein